MPRLSRQLLYKLGMGLQKSNKTLCQNLWMVLVSRRSDPLLKKANISNTLSHLDLRPWTQKALLTWSPKVSVRSADLTLQFRTKVPPRSESPVIWQASRTYFSKAKTLWPKEAMHRVEAAIVGPQARAWPYNYQSTTSRPTLSSFKSTISKSSSLNQTSPSSWTMTIKIKVNLLPEASTQRSIDESD